MNRREGREHHVSYQSSAIESGLSGVESIRQARGLTAAMYEQRLCAFVDILGFRDLVQRSLERTELQEQIRELLREVVLARPVWERDPPLTEIEARVRQRGAADPRGEAEQIVKGYAACERGTTFSDSLVLSAALNPRGITGLVTSLLFLSRGLAELGYYARGGVCLGALCHEADLCFGPAFIAAYDLEKSAAFYPRIVFSPEAYAAIAEVAAPSVGPLAPYVRRDVDGEQFLHFLNSAALDLCGSFPGGSRRQRFGVNSTVSYPLRILSQGSDRS